MKNMIACTSLLLLSLCTKAQTTATEKQDMMNIKMNAGIITAKLDETKKFYQTVLNFGISFENEFYLLMHTPNHEAQISFLLPNHPIQQPIFQKAFEGKGLYLTVEVEDVDAVYERIKKLGVKMEVNIRNEPWGDRHFSFYDPNGVGIDIVTYKKPE
ncbi:hypothetical protein BH10BAC2_BH10BAC2_29790 [soil metagenome]